MPIYYWDTTILILIPGILLALFAQGYVRSTYNKYRDQSVHSGVTGAEAARQILDGAGLYGITVERTQGYLSDHYDPVHRALRLSAEVADHATVAAVGIAAHEAGHAIQHGTGYLFLRLRTVVFPLARLSGTLTIPILLLGLLLEIASLTTLALFLYFFAVLFSLITLPVEFNASRRAMALITQNSFLSDREALGAKKVLRAAALTYVASFLLSLLQFLRLLAIVGPRRRP